MSKLSELVTVLTALRDNYDEVDPEVVLASDEEGNSFRAWSGFVELGVYDKAERDFYGIDDEEAGETDYAMDLVPAIVLWP